MFILPNVVPYSRSTPSIHKINQHEVYNYIIVSNVYLIYSSVSSATQYLPVKHLSGNDPCTRSSKPPVKSKLEVAVSGYNKTSVLS